MHAFPMIYSKDINKMRIFLLDTWKNIKKISGLSSGRLSQLSNNNLERGIMCKVA